MSTGEPAPPPVATKTYSGIRTDVGCVVAVTTSREGGVTESRLLSPRRDFRNHSSDFDWGSASAGSAQLALAILADYLEDRELALELHRAFKLRVVASLAHDGWTLTDDDVAEAILQLG
jgi:hypothetical protein